MSLETKNFYSTHSSHLIPCGFTIFDCIFFQVPTQNTSCHPQSMVKVPFNVYYRCLLQLGPSWVRCWRRILCNVLLHARHWMTATWAQCWQVWAIHRSLSNAMCNWCSPGGWRVMSSRHFSYQRWNQSSRQIAATLRLHLSQIPSAQESIASECHPRSLSWPCQDL